MTGAIAGKVPPHDLDAEAAVLSAAMLETSVVRKVRAVISDPKVLYSEANQRILEAVYALSDEGQPFDIVTASKWLAARGWLAQVGGVKYLAQIVDATPSVGNVVAHAEIVAEKHRLRRLIATCHETLATAYGEIEHVGKFLVETNAKMREACSVNGRVSGRSGSEIMSDIYNDLTSDEPEDIDGVYTGILPIDRITGVMRFGSVTTVLAYSSHGKSAFCTGLVDEAMGHGSGRAKCDDCHKIMPNPWRQAYIKNIDVGEPSCPNCGSLNIRTMRAGVIVFSGEMKEKEYGRRILQNRARVNLRDYKAGRVDANQREEVLLAINDLSLDSLWIDSKTMDVEGICAIVEAKQWEFAEKGTDLCLVIIDYAQRLKVKKFKGTRREELGAAGAAIKEMAITRNVAVVLPAQLNEEARKKDRPPNAENVREAQDIVMDSDNCIVIYAPHRDESVNTDLTKPQERKAEPVQFRLGKGRDGSRGNIPGAFLPWLTCFTAWDLKWGEWALPEHEKKSDDEGGKGRR